MTFRIEEKLDIGPSRLGDFLEWLSDSGGQLEFPSRRVVSVYFDDDQFTMFHQSSEGTLPRRKLRLRRYGDGSLLSDAWSLEMKVASIEGRFKTVREEVDAHKLVETGLVDPVHGLCQPRVEVDYRRNYYVLDGIRVTVDRDIRYRRPVLGELDGSGFVVHDPELIVEVKAGPNHPTDDLLGRFPWSRARFSKYCRAVGAIVFREPLARW